MSARITSFERNGLTFPVTDSGPIDGDLVVLLHGFPQTPTSWLATAELLHGKGLRTVIPTQRGYAHSAKPTRRRDYSTAELAADIGALLDITGPAHVAGHDWGSSIAWLVAATYPDSVRSLTAVSVPHPFAFLRSMVRSKQALQSYYMVLFQLPFLPEILAERFPASWQRPCGAADYQRPPRTP